MAKATQLSLCPKCGAELPNPKPQYCPQCRFMLIAPTSNAFGSPDYLYTQYLEHQNEDINTLKDDTAKAKLEIKLQAELELWARSCPDIDRVGALSDAMTVMKHITQSNASISTIRSITGFGKKIGELAQAIETYASKGGTFHVSPLSPAPKPGNPEPGSEPT